jgi:hypothetical protein
MTPKPNPEDVLREAKDLEAAARAIYVHAVIDDVLAQTDSEDDSDRDLCHERKVKAEAEHSHAIDRLVSVAQKVGEIRHLGCRYDPTCDTSRATLVTRCPDCVQRDRLLAELEGMK